MTGGRERLAAIPHLQTGPAVKRFDYGDHLARQYGVTLAPVACERGELPTTLTTKNRDRVRCPKCLEASRHVCPGFAGTGCVDPDCDRRADA